MNRTRKCPICGGAVAPTAENRAHPFCSDRCRLLDLGKWLDEGYVIAEPLGDRPEGRVPVDEDDDER